MNFESGVLNVEKMYIFKSTVTGFEYFKKSNKDKAPAIV